MYSNQAFIVQSLRDKIDPHLEEGLDFCKLYHKENHYFFKFAYLEPNVFKRDLDEFWEAWHLIWSEVDHIREWYLGCTLVVVTRLAEPSEHDFPEDVTRCVLSDYELSHLVLPTASPCGPPPNHSMVDRILKSVHEGLGPYYCDLNKEILSKAEAYLKGDYRIHASQVAYSLGLRTPKGGPGKPHLDLLSAINVEHTRRHPGFGEQPWLDHYKSLIPTAWDHLEEDDFGE